MGALVLVRSLAEMGRDLADTAHAIWFTVAIFVCTAWVLAWVGVAGVVAASARSAR